MKKALISFVVLLLMITAVQKGTVKADNLTISEPSDLYGLSALLLNAETGEVLYEKNADIPTAVASTTKVLTCLIALEEGNLNDIVTISSNAAAQPDVQMNAAEGEEYTISDLLKGMMLESYNDISVAIAEHIAGSEDGFAELMNQKAAELGCENSHFITPNGLDSESDGIENFSTAKDMGKILCAAIQNEDFLEITQTLQWEIHELHGKRTVTATNKNRLLQEYDGMLTGKTGYTSKAGYCYVGAASRDERTFVAVTLGSGWPPHKNYKWTDIRTLLDYGFNNYHYRSIDYMGVEIPESISVKNAVDQDGKTINIIPLHVPEIPRILLRDDESYYGKVYLKPNANAPIEKSEMLGRIEIYRNDKAIGVENITAIDDVQKSTLWYQIWQKICYFFDKIS